MATTQRQFPGAPINGSGARSAGVSAATTGIKQTYTVPAGKQAVVRSAGVFPTAGAATIALQAVFSGTAVNVVSGTAALLFAAGITLDTGDSFRVNVTVLDAAGVFDWHLSVEEYLAQ